MIQQDGNALPLHEIEAVLRIGREPLIHIFLRNILPLIIGTECRRAADKMPVFQLELPIPFVERHDALRYGLRNAAFRILHEIPAGDQLMQPLRAPARLHIRIAIRQRSQRRSQCRCIAARCRDADAALRDQLRDTSCRSRDRRNAGQHSLQCGHGTGMIVILICKGDQHAVDLAVKCCHIAPAEPHLAVRRIGQIIRHRNGIRIAPEHQKMQLRIRADDLAERGDPPRIGLLRPHR